MYNGASGSGAASGSGGSPAPRPGFSRISSSMVEVSSPKDSGTPVPSDRTKVAFGLNKRKAGEDPNGTPPPKRR